MSFHSWFQARDVSKQALIASQQFRWERCEKGGSLFEQ